MRSSRSSEPKLQGLGPAGPALSLAIRIALRIARSSACSSVLFSATFD